MECRGKTTAVHERILMLLLKDSINYTLQRGNCQVIFFIFQKRAGVSPQQDEYVGSARFVRIY